VRTAPVAGGKMRHDDQETDPILFLDENLLDTNQATFIE